MLNESSSAAKQRMCRIACLLFGIVTILSGRMAGQSAPVESPPPSDASEPTMPPAITLPQIMPYGRNGTSATKKSESQDDSDLASERSQEKNLDRALQADQRKTAAITSLPQPLSEFQQIVARSIGRTLPIFGEDLFSDIPSTFAPVDNIPVTPDYVIGPGDELRLQVWGQINQIASYVVDRTGSIQLPEVGTVHVAGVQFSQLAPFLKVQLGRVYRNFDLNVNLGQLRSIQVFVVGKAKQPGSYTIGSLSTLLNALFASGGPLPQGSLRDIQVKRSGETITHFDLYDLLLNGDKSKDVRLASGDVIFIPKAGPQVAVVGSVTTSAIYELRGEQSFAQVVALAGGETSAAAGGHVRVERIYRHTERSLIDVDLASPAAAPVQDGDIVYISSVLPRFNDTITLRGNVASPGRYVWRKGMRIKDLIPSRESLITRNYYVRNNELGQTNTDYTGPLPEGSLHVRPDSAADTPAGQGGGGAAAAAITPHSAAFGAKTDVILSAPDIDWDYAVIERQNAIDLTTSLIPFNLGGIVLENDASQDIELVPGDVVTIFSKADIRVPSAQQTSFVKLEGEFVHAGVYSVRPDETLGKLIQRAGGLTKDADLFASEFTRDSVRTIQRQRLEEYANLLESEIAAHSSVSSATAITERDAAAAQSSEAGNLAALAQLRRSQPTGRIILQFKPNSNSTAPVDAVALEDGDRFVVPKVPSSVNVQGQVYNANAFLYENGKRVLDYLHLAGGPERTADEKRAYILRADGSVLSRQYASSRQHGAFNGIPVLPGDTIVIPPKLDKGAFLRNLLDVSTILQGFGLGAAAIEVLK